jgi:peptidoglycan/LPS O-acetylase OafA/YrhL
VHTFVPLFLWVPAHMRGTLWEWAFRLGLFPSISIAVAALSWLLIEGPIRRRAPSYPPS